MHRCRVEESDSSDDSTDPPTHTSTPHRSKDTASDAKTCRSSERIRKKQRREFCMPSRQDVLDSIESVPTHRSSAYLKPRKHINSLVKNNYRYNYDTDGTDSHGSLDDFIVEPYEEGSISESSTGCQPLPSSDSEDASQCDRKSSQSDEDIPVRHHVSRNRSTIIDSSSDEDTLPSNEYAVAPKKDTLTTKNDAISSDKEAVTCGEDLVTSDEDAVTPGRSCHGRRVLVDSESEHSDSGLGPVDLSLFDDSNSSTGWDINQVEVTKASRHTSPRQDSAADTSCESGGEDLSFSPACIDACIDGYDADSMEDVVTPMRHNKSHVILSDSDDSSPDISRYTAIKSRKRSACDSNTSGELSETETGGERLSKRPRPWEKKRQLRKKLFSALRKKAALKTSKTDCECGRTQQTPRHVLLECELFTAQRARLMDRIDHMYVQHGTPPWERTLDLGTLLWPCHTSPMTVRGVEDALADYLADLPVEYDIGT